MHPTPLPDLTCRLKTLQHPQAPASAASAPAPAPAPPKRGRRGSGGGGGAGAGAGGDEGTTTSRGGGRARRQNSAASVDEDGDGKGAGGRGGGGRDQLLLRDRRSRIAARALRSSGSVFDMGSIVKGMGSSWLSGGEQVEQLKVVRVEERDVAVDPPAVPPGLVSFLGQRKARRDREVSEGRGDHRGAAWSGVVLGPSLRKAGGLCILLCWKSCFQRWSWLCSPFVCIRSTPSLFSRLPKQSGLACLFFFLPFFTFFALPCLALPCRQVEVLFPMCFRHGLSHLDLPVRAAGV